MKIAGVLQIIQSFMLLQFSVLFVVRVILDLREGSIPLSEHLELIPLLALALTLVIGACQIWFGICLTKQRPWTTRVWGFLCCAPGLFVFPIVFSAYTLWVLIWVCRKDASVMTGPIG
jgi:hypothetical protein